MFVVFANSGLFSSEGEAALCGGGPCPGPRRVSINYLVSGAVLMPRCLSQSLWISMWFRVRGVYPGDGRGLKNPLTSHKSLTGPLLTGVHTARSLKGLHGLRRRTD